MNNEIPRFAIVAMLVAAVLFSACIELKPVASLPTSVNVSIETGSGACAGMTEASCGAIVKEKRIQSGAWRCQGVEGPADALAVYANGTLISSTYDLSMSSGWECNPTSPDAFKEIYLGMQSSSDTPSGKMGMISLIANISNANLGLFRVTATQCTVSIPCIGHSAKITPYCGIMELEITKDYSLSPGNCNYIYGVQGGTQGTNCPFLFTPSELAGMPFIPTTTKIVASVLVDATESESETSFTLSCGIWAKYNVSYTCANKRQYPITPYEFYNCTPEEASTIGTFQGGSMETDFNIPRGELNDMITGYYATGKKSTKQIPFFMVGQGSTFDEFENARLECNPFYENIVNISLGNLVFNPVSLKVQEGTSVCWNNTDNKDHLIQVDLTSMQIPKDESSCAQFSNGTHSVKDITTGFEDNLIIAQKGESLGIYISGKVSPEYSAVESGKDIEFMLNDPNRHGIILNLADFITGARETVKASLISGLISGDPNTEKFVFNTNSTIRGLLGEQEIIDNSTGQSAAFFIYSPESTFKFFLPTDPINVTPASKFIARPLGDSVCFTASDEITGSDSLLVTISINTDAEGWKEIYKEKPLVAGKECCYTPATGGYYKASVSDGREVYFLISQKQPTATIDIQQIGFKPESITANPSVRLCLNNPVPQSRTVNVSSTLQSGTGAAYTDSNKAVSVPPFGEDCSLLFNKQGVLRLRFEPDLDITGSIIISSAKTNTLKITSYGFDPPFIQAKPGDRICITNTDTKNHSLTRLSSTSFPLAENSLGQYPSVMTANETVCFVVRPDDTSNYFAFKHDASGLYGMINVFDEGEYGIIITPFGISPSRIDIPISTPSMVVAGRYINESKRLVKIVNRQDATVSLFSEQDVTATEKTITPSAISIIVPLRARIYNKDRINHTISITGAQPYVSQPNDVNISEFSRGSYLISDETLHSEGAKIYSVKIDVGSVAYINSLAKSGVPGYDTSFYAPYTPGVYSFKETKGGTSTNIIFSAPSEETAQVPILNETMDLPVQYVSGYISPDILAKMREYSDRGMISAIIPNFKDIVVRIKYSSFTPEDLIITAGSSVKLKNIDNIDHAINITRSNYSSMCQTENSSNYQCRLDPLRNICQAQLVASSEQTCIQYESDFNCIRNASTQTYSLVTCPKTSLCEDFNYMNPTNQNSLLCWNSGVSPTGTCTSRYPGLTCDWLGDYCQVKEKTTDSRIYAYLYCTKQTTIACNMNPDYDPFGQEYLCSPSGSACQLSKMQTQDGWIDDLSGAYCNYTYSYTSESRLVELALQQEYSINTTRDSIYSLNDTRFGNIGSVNITNLDADVRVGFSQIYPELAQIAPWQRAKFLNFRGVSETAAYSERPLAGEALIGTLGISAYNNTSNAPGENSYYPIGEGNITFSFSSTPKKLSVQVSSAPVEFKVKLSQEGFNASSAAIYKDSKVCISSDTLRNVRVLKGTETINSGPVLGNQPTAAEACNSIYSCNSSDQSIECKGLLNTTNNKCMYRVKSGAVSKCFLNTTVAPTPVSKYPSEIICRLSSDKSKCEFMATNVNVDPYLSNPSAPVSPGIPAICASTASDTCKPKKEVSPPLTPSDLVSCSTDSGRCKFSPVTITTDSIYCSGTSKAGKTSCSSSCPYPSILSHNCLPLYYMGVRLTSPQTCSFTVNNDNCGPDPCVMIYKKLVLVVLCNSGEYKCASAYEGQTISVSCGGSGNYIKNIITAEYGNAYTTTASSDVLCQGTACASIYGNKQTLNDNIECILQPPQSGGTCYVGPLSPASGSTVYTNEYCTVAHPAPICGSDTFCGWNGENCGGSNQGQCRHYNPQTCYQGHMEAGDAGCHDYCTSCNSVSNTCTKPTGNTACSGKPCTGSTYINKWNPSCLLGTCKKIKGKMCWDANEIYTSHVKYNWCADGNQACDPTPSGITCVAERSSYNSASDNNNWGCPYLRACRDSYDCSFYNYYNAYTGNPSDCAARTASVNCGRSGMGCSYSSSGLAPPKPCTSFANCPCIECKKKPIYLPASNLECSVTSTGSGCSLSKNVWAGDLYWNSITNEGAYCRIAFEPRCEKMPGYEGFECECNKPSPTSPCTASSTCKFAGYSSTVDPSDRDPNPSGWAYDLQSNPTYPICNANTITDCESKPGVQGVKCEAANGQCKVSESAAEFCWQAASEGDYMIEDIATGKRMDVKVYSPFDPLEASIGKSYLNPSLVLTSPESKVCFTSGDGDSHSIKIGDSTFAIGTAFTCMNFSEGEHSAQMIGSVATADIISETNNKTISIRQKVFEPESAILRPYSSITFNNLDSKSHYLCYFDPTSTDNPSRILFYTFVSQGGTVRTNSYSPEFWVSDADIPEFQDYGTCKKKYTTLKFTLPSRTESAKIGMLFNGNGTVRFIGNGEEEWNVTSSSCAGGFTTKEEHDITKEKINYGGENYIQIQTCSCKEGDYGIDIELSYLYKESTGCSGGTMFEVPGLSVKKIFPQYGESELPVTLSYWDNDTPRSFKLTVKNCNGSDMSDIANAIGGYDSEYPGYDTEKCNTGSLEECTEYNPHGPSTIAIVTTEEGLDLNRNNDLQCAAEQIDTIHRDCPNCTATLMVGKTDITKLDSILYNLRTGTSSLNCISKDPALYNCTPASSSTTETNCNVSLIGKGACDHSTVRCTPITSAISCSQILGKCAFKVIDSTSPSLCDDDCKPKYIGIKCSQSGGNCEAGPPTTTQTDTLCTKSVDQNCYFDDANYSFFKDTTICKSNPCEVGSSQPKLDSLNSYCDSVTEIKPDLVAHSLLFNEYPECDLAPMMERLVNMSKMTLYKYHTPSVLLKMGAKEQPPCWNNETLTAAYKSFYSDWIPILAGSGFIGAAQYCYGSCPGEGNEGYNIQGKTFSDAWFKEGCGGYYYEGNGLSLLTFSSRESNYSFCDPSKMFLLLQQMKCIQEGAGIAK